MRLIKLEPVNGSPVWINAYNIKEILSFELDDGIYTKVITFKDSVYVLKKNPEDVVQEINELMR